MREPKFSIDRGFRFIARSLQNDFQAARQQVTDVGHGEDVEAALIGMLTGFLPARFGVSRGHVFDWANGKSDRLDVIVYDALNCPRLQDPSRIGYYPTDTVLAVIEVTDQKLGTRKLAEDCKRIHKAKSLGWTGMIPPGFEDPGPCGIVFAVRAIDDVQRLVRKVAAERERLVAAHCGRQCVNAVVVMNRGIILYREPWTGQIGFGPMTTATRGGETRLWEPFYAEAGEDTLALFCALLLHRFQIHLEAQILGRANLVHCIRHRLDPTKSSPRLPQSAAVDAQIVLPDLFTYLWGATGGAGIVAGPSRSRSRESET